MTAVYEYGIPFDPVDGAEFVDEQISLAHRYYNTLIELERGRREARLGAQRADADVGPLIELEEMLDADVAAGDEGARAQRDEIRKALKAARKLAAPQLKPLYDEMDAAHNAAKKAARASCGVYWGTYGQVENAADAAAKAVPMYTMPSFRRWTGEGMVAVQFQRQTKPVRLQPTDETIFHEDSRFSIAPVDPAAWSKEAPRGERGRLSRTTFTMRVGKNQGEMATFRMVMHRPLPTGCRVTWAKVVRRRIDDRRHRFKYALQLTVETDRMECHPLLNRAGSAPIVAVNLGWRALPDGSLRVATWVGTDGREGTLELGREEYRDRIERAEGVRSRRDMRLDELKVELAGHKARILEDYGMDVSRSKSFEKFHSLHWRVSRDYTESGDDELRVILDALEPWHHSDRHRWQYERGTDNRARRFRREKYRLLAVQLAKKYPVVCVESWDMRPVVTDEDRLPGPSAARVEGAPSEARQIIRNTAGREGCIVLTQPSSSVALATQTCHLCGYGAKKCERWDAAKSLDHTCEGCGETWNQDVNFCRNILAASVDVVTKTPELLAPKIVKSAGRFRKKSAK